MLPGSIDDNLREQVIALLQDPDVINHLHNYSDYNDAPEGLHHSLGLRHDQASYGDHAHNGKDSVDLGNAYVTIGTTQTITGAKIFTAATTFDLAVTLTGQTLPNLLFTPGAGPNSAQIIASSAALNFDVLSGNSWFFRNGINGSNVITLDTTGKISATGGIFGTDTVECDGSNAALWTSVRSNNAGKWAIYSQAGTLAFYWNSGTGGSAGDKLSIDINGFVSCGGITTNGGAASTGLLTVSAANGYGNDAAEFNNTSGAAAIRVGDGTRFAWVGVATAANDWISGTQSGDMVLRSTNGRVVTSGTIVGTNQLIFTAIGTRTTSVAGGSAVALPANPVGYMGILINGTSRVVPYYT